MLKIKGLKRAKLCTFQGQSYSRYCHRPVAPGETDRCKEHAGLVCVICGDRASRFCSDAFYGRCGECGHVVMDAECRAPLCGTTRCREKHDHAVDHDTKEQTALREEYRYGRDQGD